MRRGLLILTILIACGERSTTPKPQDRDSPGKAEPRSDADPEESSLDRRFEIVLGRGFQPSDTLADTQIEVVADAPLALKGVSGLVSKSLPEGVNPLRVLQARVQFGSNKPVLLVAEGVLLQPEKLDTSTPGPYKLTLHRRGGACAIRVNLSTSDGDPVDGAHIDVLQPDQGGRFSDRVAVLKTSPEGRALANRLGPGRYRVALVDAGRFAETGVMKPDSRRDNYSEVAVKDGEIITVTLTAGTAGAIRGNIEGIDAKEAAVRLSLRRHWADGVWRPVDRSIERAGMEFSIPGLAPGPYVLLTRVRGHEVGYARFEVRPSQETVVVAHPGQKTDRQVRVAITDRPADRRVRFALDRVGVVEQDVALGRGREDVFVLDAPGTPRPGDYLLLFWDLDLCLPVRVFGEATQTLSVSWPRDPVGAGKHEVAVRVEMNGEAIWRLCACLRPVGARDDSPMRFDETMPVARFRGVPAGEYEVLAYDGTFGVFAGFHPSPARKRVRVSDEDLSVTLNVEPANK